jgi:predicted lysophospholipase L1 biosynthesis ABC-type transport system permease subunit
VIAEYVFLGLISALAGALLSSIAGWALALYFFKTSAAVSLEAMLSVPVLITALTVIAGVLGCWGIFRRSALETLRAEA